MVTVTAHFDLQSLREPIIVLEPSNSIEALLLAVFIRYDANVFSVSVDRSEDGHVQRVRLLASEAS